MPTAINDKPCDTCEHFDPVMRGQAGKGGVRETTWGWCASRSIYPTREGPGQRFPAGVKRAEEGELAKPIIIRKKQVVSNCRLYTAKSSKKSKTDLLKQMQEKSGGRIIG